MQYIDIIIAIPILWGAFIGFKKGLILELASFVALALGILGAIKFSHLTGEFLNSHIDISAQWLGFISFLFTFILIVLAVFLLAKIIDKALKVAALGLVNRLFGLLFGVLKYALIVSVLLYFYETLNSKFGFSKDRISEKSILYGPVRAISSPFKPLLQEFSVTDIKDRVLEE